MHPAFLKTSFFLLVGMFQGNIRVEELRARSDLKTKLKNSLISKSYDQNEFSIVFLKEIITFVAKVVKVVV